MSEKEINDIISKNLAYYLEQRNKTQLELAEYLGVSQATVSNWCKGIKMPRMKKIDSICEYLEIKRTDLMEERDSIVNLNNNYAPTLRPVKTQRFPMLGSVAAGKPILMSEEVDIYVDIDNPIKADYVLTAKGDSMIGARINDGDIVFVRQQPIVNNGEIAVVAIDDEATLKRFYKYGDDLIVLRAENPKYQDMEFRPKDGKVIRVLGKAVKFQSDIC